jgi:hypothetical protein
VPATRRLRLSAPSYSRLPWNDAGTYRDGASVRRLLATVKRRLNTGRTGEPDGVSALRYPRRALIAALAAAFLVYLVAGHAHHPGQSMEEAAMGAGICIVLVTFVAAVTALVRPRPSAFVAPLLVALGGHAPAVPADAADARASPVWLQRFLN